MTYSEGICIVIAAVFVYTLIRVGCEVWRDYRDFKRDLGR